MSKEGQLSAKDFVHLHNHTQYSLLDGLTKVPDLVGLVKEMGMSSVAMTDHGTLSGTIEFYKEASAQGVKPLIGIETYVATRKHTDKEPQKDKNRFHLILLAMNNAGYQNMMKLSTIANLEGYYYYPRIDHDLIEKYNEGLIALSGCMSGEIGDALKQDQYARAVETAKWYKGIFGDRYYLEVQDHGHPDNPLTSPEQQQVNEQVFHLGKELDIPVVLTCDAHYLKHEDQEAHEILLCVGTGSFLSDTHRMSLKDFPLHVEDPKVLIKRWGDDHPEIIRNTTMVAERCNVVIELGKILIPKFPTPKGDNEKTYLQKLVWRGLAWRYGGVDEGKAANLSEAAAKKALSKQVSDRAEYEMSVIDQMGFNGYFLIIADFINWGKNTGIVFGPGRGSAAGSIIAYSLKITELDPLKYELLFERFLNPDRISMPDIDIDIQDTRRDEVIKYCVEKYGSNRVANIVTFGRMFARNAVRDVSRVLQVPYAEADRLAKMLPLPIQGRHVPLETALTNDADLKTEYETNPTSKQVLDLAQRLEGTVRSHGVHAAGVVIAPDDIVKFVPLEMAQKGVVATQYPMGPIEELGLLKMDFLGLSNLTIIKNTLRIIKKVYSEDIEISNIPLDDLKTFELFQKGDTTGVFQFESAGMKRYLKELQPTVFDDLIAMNALYRPGPMQWIDDFITRKHGVKNTEYLHPKAEAALKNTYGVLVYQEQVMQIAKDLCGFTGGQADTLRKGIAKKKPEVLKALKKDFIEGALSNSDISKSKIETFWTQLEAFAAYCFPKAHASCYATIAYWTAYLKAHYPSAFMAALMTSDFNDTDRLTIEITECQHMGINVLAPDINESFAEFGVVPDQKDRDQRIVPIRFALNAVKNVGTAAVEEIVRVRESKGSFLTLEQFLETVDSHLVNRKSIESLVKAGAFDRFGDRSTLLFNLDSILAYASRLQKQASSGQTDLFGNLIEVTETRPKLTLESPTSIYDTHELLAWERELLGLYLSQHPLKSFEVYLSEKTIPLNMITPDSDGKNIAVGGTIVQVREIATKNGKKMAFVKLEDLFGEIEIIVFPNVFAQTHEIWQRDKIALVSGVVDAKTRSGSISNEVKVLANDARELTVAEASSFKPTGKKPKLSTPKMMDALVDTKTTSKTLPERVYLRLDDTSDSSKLVSLKQAIDKHTGDTEVVLVLGNDSKRQIIKLPTGVNKDSEAINHLRELVGVENVKVQ